MRPDIIPIAMIGVASCAKVACPLDWGLALGFPFPGDGDRDFLSFFSFLSFLSFLSRGDLLGEFEREERGELGLD